MKIKKLGMGNRCYVCKKYGETIVIQLNDNVSYYHRQTVSIHYECFPECECGEVYSDNHWKEWTTTSSGIIYHKCYKQKCISCNVPIFKEDFNYNRPYGIKMWHVRCEPSDNNWPICNETNIALCFCSFPREYRRYMLFQYWTLRRFICDKNIVWKIVTTAVYPYGYATEIQNGLLTTDIMNRNSGKSLTEKCKCGELKQYLTNYIPRCNNGCYYTIDKKIDKICQILNIPTDLTYGQKLIAISNLHY